jgi:hypothetical protein
VSSYGRNTFTRGAPYLRLVRCLLYTFAVATCRSTPHLRRRNSRGSPPGRVVPLGTSRAASSPGPKCSWCAALPAFPNLRCRSIAVRAFGFEGQHRSDRSPLHNKTHITRGALVFPSNPHRQDSLVLAGAACGPKPSAWLDVDRDSEGHFPLQGVLRITKSALHNISISSNFLLAFCHTLPLNFSLPMTSISMIKGYCGDVQRFWQSHPLL